MEGSALVSGKDDQSMLRTLAMSVGRASEVAIEVDGWELGSEGYKGFLNCQTRRLPVHGQETERDGRERKSGPRGEKS